MSTLTSNTLFGASLAGSAHAQEQQTARSQSGTRTFYDASGRISGTASISDNVTTFRDRIGRITGTGERAPDGRTQFRDAFGRMTGIAAIIRWPFGG